MTATSVPERTYAQPGEPVSGGWRRKRGSACELLFDLFDQAPGFGDRSPDAANDVVERGQTAREALYDGWGFADADRINLG